MKELADDYGFSPSQIGNIVGLMKNGSMIQFIGHCCSLFKLDPLEGNLQTATKVLGGIHKANGKVPWSQQTVLLVRGFISRITSGHLSLLEAQKEIVSWARYERFKRKRTTPSVIVLSEDDK
jgi:hypothetical protein